MSGLGVPDQAFFTLQDDMLRRLADMLVREHAAVDAVAQVNYHDTTRRAILTYAPKLTQVCVSRECSLMHPRLHTVLLVRLPGLLPSRRRVSASLARVGSWQSSSSGSRE